MYGLIAIDLDGTLLDDQGQIPQSNICYIKKALDQNVKVALCSGRSYISLKFFEEQLGLVGKGNYGICFNGGTVYEADTQKIIHEIRLANETARFIIKEVRYFGVDTVVYIGERLLSENPTDRILDYQEKSRVPLTIVENLEEIEEDVSKVLLRGDFETLSKVKAFMKPLLMNKCNVVFSEKTLLEFTNIMAHKGTGIRILAEHLGIPMEEVIAIGNGDNDIDMLRDAGLGVAVANAEERVKRYADYVTQCDNNKGAIQEVVEKFILEN